MATAFDAVIAGCRQAYVEFQQLAGRTDESLYRALGQIHALRHRMSTEPVLRASFDELLQGHAGGKSLKETLFLVKYAFFPHTLQPGPGNKSDITKASRYSKLINKALDQNVGPVDFVAFARQHGIQRTAVTMAGKRPARGRDPRRQGRHSPSSTQSVQASAFFVRDIVAPLEPWFYSSGVAARFARALVDAADHPQKISLTVYLNDKRGVLTGVRQQAWDGQFPDGAVRIDTVAAVQAPASVGAQAPSPQFAQTPASPIALRGRTLPPTHTIRNRRGRSADGYFWPNWRMFAR